MALRVAIIGGGQNSLVAAFYLARAGHKPLVLERRPVVGGLTITEEFHPGFRASLLDGAFGPLPAQVAKDMQLERHGVQWLKPQIQIFAPSPDGRALLFDSDPRAAAKCIEGFSKSDAAKYLQLADIIESAAPLVRHLLTMTPPEIDRPSAVDIWNLLRAGRQFRGLGKRNMQHLLRWGPMAVADFVAEFFETELLRAAMAAPAIFGAAAGPWSAGTTALFLLRTGAAGSPGVASASAKGGAGAISEAMAAAAKQAGAEIHTGAEVERINIKNGAVSGVVFANGEEIAASAVVSGADPKRTFLQLLDAEYLAPSFLAKMQNYRSKGVVARIFLALDGLPNFTALENASETDAALAARIHIGPEIDYLEHAFDDSKYGDFSRAPYLEASIPTLLDASLAPVGKHVMSIHMQYAPYKLTNGDWSKRRDALADVVVKTLAQYAPDLPQHILARRVITPLDFEEIYGVTGGHIFHGEPALDQLFTMRPLLGWARYRTPIRGLFLCGSGTHPGAGLTGASGFNAAREILKSVKG
ncbi:MAG TPA: NAD(P)/FAD-dependent oxidoreductase [Candidatus Acidoferrales bacterium]|nr:NAD(P)/FAD-dependent oxidoreductase [Candidatus Acidoferrales bacterium]